MHATAIARSVPLLLALCAGAPASAQTGQVSTYNITHTFNLFAPAADTARVFVYDFRHVWLATNGQQDEDHTPAAQDPLFDPYGVETFGAGGVPFNSGLGGGPVPVLYNIGQIAPSGAPGTPACLFLGLQASQAMACNAVRVDPWVNQSPIDLTGSISSFGYADAAVQGRGAALAYAFSTAAIRVDSGVTLANGTIQWQIGAVVDSVGGGAGEIEIKDPVILTATNTATGDSQSHTLVEVDMSHGGAGHVDITGPAMTVDIPEFRLEIAVGSPVIDPAQAGEFRLEVLGGVVQTASASGIFAGSAPPLGTAIPFSVAMPPITLDYDLGLDPTQPWEVSAEMGGGGGSRSRIDSAACPADLAEPFGVLDLADINAFIAGFVDQSPAADLNEDGVFDLGDIGLFIESFLGGCLDADAG
jgi:hypothetical protein